MDEQSLALKGKKSKATVAPTKKVLEKRKTPNDEADVSKKIKAAPKKAKIDLTGDDHIDLTKDEDNEEEPRLDGNISSPEKAESEDRSELEAIIDSSEKTEFQKKCLKLLLQIPKGHFSTYGMSFRITWILHILADTIVQVLWRER